MIEHRRKFYVLFRPGHPSTNLGTAGSRFPARCCLWQTSSFVELNNQLHFIACVSPPGFSGFVLKGSDFFACLRICQERFPKVILFLDTLDGVICSPDWFMLWGKCVFTIDTEPSTRPSPKNPLSKSCWSFCVDPVNTPETKGKG